MLLRNKTPNSIGGGVCGGSRTLTLIEVSRPVHSRVCRWQVFRQWFECIDPGYNSVVLKVSLSSEIQSQPLLGTDQAQLRCKFGRGNGSCVKSGMRILRTLPLPSSTNNVPFLSGMYVQECVCIAVLFIGIVDTRVSSSRGVSRT